MTQQKYRKIKKWFITFPDSQDRSEFWIWNVWKADIYFYEAACGVKEAHDESGKAHLHFAVHLKHGISKIQLLDKIKALEPDNWKRIHFVPMKSTVERCHEEYLAKEGVPWIREFKEPYHDHVRRCDKEFYNNSVKHGLIYDKELTPDSYFEEWWFMPSNHNDVPEEWRDIVAERKRVRGWVF